MPHMKCLRMHGCGLTGQTFGLFHKRPAKVIKTSKHQGVTDLCHKLQFEKPFCVVRAMPLLPPFAVVPMIQEPYPLVMQRGGHDVFKKPHLVEAIEYMSRLPFVGVDLPFFNRYDITQYGEYSGGISGPYSAMQRYRTQSFAAPPGSILAEWLWDDRIELSLAFSTPMPFRTAVGLQLRCFKSVIDFGVERHEFVLDKSDIISAGNKKQFTLEPLNFSANDFLTLLHEGAGDFFSLAVTTGSLLPVVINAYNVHTGYQVCFPEDFFNAAQLIAAVDETTGNVVGPMFGVSKGKLYAPNN